MKHEKLPDMATLKELGRDMEFCIDSWWFAPKGTPAEAIDGMASALEAASVVNTRTGDMAVRVLKKIGVRWLSTCPTRMMSR